MTKCHHYDINNVSTKKEVTKCDARREVRGIYKEEKEGVVYLIGKSSLSTEEEVLLIGEEV